LAVFPFKYLATTIWS